MAENITADGGRTTIPETIMPGWSLGIYYIPVHACMFEPQSVLIVGNDLLLPTTTNRD